MKKYQGHLAILGANFIFGLNVSLSKVALQAVGPQLLTLFRVCGAALLFWIVSLFLPRERVTKRDLLLLLGASLFGIIINQFSYLEGLSRTGVIDAAIVSTQTPIFTMLLAALFLREPITWKKAVGVLLGMSGALILILQSGTMLFQGNVDGILFCLISSISFALYLTLFRHLIQRYTPVTLMKWMFLYASFFGLILYSDSIIRFDPSTLAPIVWWEIAYVVIAATFLAYILIPCAQQTLRPTTISMYNYLQPILAALSAVVLGLDALTWSKLLAIVLVFVGVYLVTQSKSRAQLEASELKTQSPTIKHEAL